MYVTEPLSHSPHEVDAVVGLSLCNGEHTHSHTKHYLDFGHCSLPCQSCILAVKTSRMHNNETIITTPIQLRELRAISE